MAFRLPRLRLNPHFLAAIRESRHPHHLLTVVGGFSQPSEFSTNLSAGVVTDTTANVTRWQRVAELVGFPPEMVFLDESTAKQRDDFSEMPVVKSDERRAS